MFAALEPGEAILERVARGIARARILEALVYARARLRERARQDDRRHDGAGGWIGVLAGVNGECLYFHGVQGGGP